MENHYNILGIPINASKDEIKEAFKMQIKKYHPDLFNHKNIEEILYAENMTKKLISAYEILSDDINRKVYDYQLFPDEGQSGNYSLNRKSKKIKLSKEIKIIGVYERIIPDKVVIKNKEIVFGYINTKGIFVFEGFQFTEDYYHEEYSSRATIAFHKIEEDNPWLKEHFKLMKNNIIPINKQNVLAIVNDWLKRNNGYENVIDSTKKTLERRMYQLMESLRIP
jgi:curved DNA-binding protein CbpA